LAKVSNFPEFFSKRSILQHFKNSKPHQDGLVLLTNFVHLILHAFVTLPNQEISKTMSLKIS